MYDANSDAADASLFRGVRDEIETLMDVNLGAFMHGRRASWKRQIKWEAVASNKLDALSGRNAAPRGAETAGRLATWLAGGDAALERRLREHGEVLQSGDIDRVVRVIAMYESCNVLNI